MGWLTGWTYRKEITVTNASANYQTKVLVGESAGATGEEVDCNSHCQTDFDDIRFTGSDGTTLLDYWIESITGATPNQLATIWVENDATPSTTCYMYYGKADATAVSNGANTFIVFDDFERGNDGDTIGGSWTEGAPHVHISTEQDIGNVAGYTGTRSAKFVSTNPRAYTTIPVTASANIAIRFRYYKEDAADFDMYHGDGTTVLAALPQANENYLVYDGASSVDTTLDVQKNAWGLHEINNINWTAKTITAVIDGVTKTGIDISYASASFTNIFQMGGTITANADTWIDDFIVRKWAATEPTFAWGTEETPFPTVTTQAASLVEETTATGNGNITSLNAGANCTIRGFEYDTDTGAPYANEAHDDGDFGTGAYTKGLTGLTKGELYYARAYATNPLGTGYGSEVTFLTKPDEPTGFTATPGDQHVNLAWTKGTGAQKTMIRYRTDGTYPTGPTDGTQAYFDTSSSYDHTGLTNGTAYKYRGWSYVTEGGLEQYSDLYIEATATPLGPPTVTTQAATLIESTTCTGNGNITSLEGAGNCTRRGFCYKVGTSGDPTTADSVAYDDGSFGTGAYTKSITALSTGTSYRIRAYAVNTEGTGYGTTVQILTKPAAPTNVAATENLSAKVTITWTKSTGATDYHVWRDAVDLGAAGDVATFDDTGAGAPSITPGTASASDGTSTAHVTLSLAGESTSNGTTYTYKVVASNTTGNSADSSTDTGYRIPGTLTYQWQRSAADTDASYSNITGATTDPYNDTGAPIAGQGRYYKCVLDATGCTQATSTTDRGYRTGYTQAIYEAKILSLPRITNRVYVVGVDADGNNVFAEATNSEIPEILRVHSDSMITTEANAESVAANILAKGRLTADRGSILISPNCGKEVWDVIQINDSGCNQTNANYRVTGWVFTYNTLQETGVYQMNLRLTSV